MDLTGKVVVVAGVGKGLGSAAASVIARAGATTIAVARHRESLDRLAGFARQQGWTFRPVTADLSDAAGAKSAIDATIGEFGRVDGVAITAGRWTPGDTLLHKLSDSEWSAGITENLDAVFQMSRAVLPSMVDRGSGSIVVVSAAERVRRSGTAAYCAAKGGLVELVQKMARDYRAHGVRVNAVLPGNMEHDVDPASPPDLHGPFALRNESGSGAWEVARSIAYLLSDDSRWTTGALLTVDGGLSLHGAEPPTSGSLPPR